MGIHVRVGAGAELNVGDSHALDWIPLGAGVVDEDLHLGSNNLHG